MSEPVTHAEIEDVLTSIRKLVTETGVRAPAPEAKVEPQRGLGKLVLTPAFRVREVLAEDEREEAPEAATDTFHSRRTRPEAAAEEPRRDSQSEDPFAAFEPFVADMGAPQGEPLDEPSLEARIAELEDAVGRSHDEWEADEGDAYFEEAEDIALKPADPMPAAEEWEATAEDDWSEPQGAGTETFEAEESIEVAEEPSVLRLADVHAFPRTADRPKADTVPAFEDDGEGDFIDEEALRELVSQMVREELLGEVGERITRNVRRMVRREIQRALSLKEFE